jgi:putative ABC transport system permease protein
VARPRWRKLRGDLRAAWGRVLAMQLAIAIALAGVGTVLGARAVLGREIEASYRGTRPADATLELAGDVDETLLAAVRARPEVAEVDKRQMVRARIKQRPEDPWQMLVLFVADDFNALRLNTFRPDQGAWPPPRGSILLERTAVAVMGLGSRLPSRHGGAMHAAMAAKHGHGEMLEQLVGGGPSMIVQTPNGPPTTVRIAGTVHDAGQAPNWQEHRGCAYATRETLAALGEPPVLHELLVQFRDASAMETVEASAKQLATWLRGQGHEVHEIRVPKLRQHPHQALMNAVQIVLLVFTLLLFVLSSIVVATILSTILARQTRDIGVMKALGASTRQLAGLYAAFVVGLGAVAAAVAMPLAHAGANGMIRKVALMMNITLADPNIPTWVLVTIALLGLLVPLAIASVPILRATRMTVRQSLAHSGAGSDFARSGLSKLPIAVRNALRRPARLVLTMTLLIVGGSLVIAASNFERSLRGISSKLAIARHYDLEVRLHTPVPPDRVEDLAKLEGVRTYEAWAASDAALGDIIRTYPDGGHGSFTLTAPPSTGSSLVSFPLRAGRWLVPGDTDAVVLGGHGPGIRVGDRITLTTEGRRSTWNVVGLVDEIGGGSAFVSAAGYTQATGIDGVTLLRFETSARTDAERAAILARIEGTLAERSIPLRYAMPSPLLRSIIDDHILLVTRAVIAMAIILALVGLLGLGSAMAINVAERTREIGILKTIGASDGRLLRILVGEAMFVGAASALVALALSFPLTLLIAARMGATGLLSQPPFTLSLLAAIGWPVVTIVGSALASVLPARRAAHLTVSRALGEV